VTGTVLFAAMKENGVQHLGRQHLQRTAASRAFPTSYSSTRLCGRAEMTLDDQEAGFGYKISR
jgi:hypothetical protein